MIGFGPAHVAAAAGVVGTIVAGALLPWAHYGGIDVNVGDLPNWGFYVWSAVALHLWVIWALLVRDQGDRSQSSLLPRSIALGFGAASVVATVVVLSRYDDSEAIFGSVVPPIEPSIAWGSPVAVAAILISVGAVFAPSRHAEPAHRG